MRIISSLLCVFLFMNFSLAQVEQGNWMVSGILDTDLSLDDDDDASLFLLETGLGKFVLNRMALGGNFALSYDESEDNKTTDFSLGPFARWYILGGGDLKMFLQAKVSYIYRRRIANGSKVNDHGFEFFGAPGLSYFLTDNISVDVLMGYNYRGFGDGIVSENIRLLAGFQIFL